MIIKFDPETNGSFKVNFFKQFPQVKKEFTFNNSTNTLFNPISSIRQFHNNKVNITTKSKNSHRKS